MSIIKSKLLHAKAWWDNNSRKNIKIKTLAPIPIICESCGQTKSWGMPASAVIESPYSNIKIRNIYENK